MLLALDVGNSNVVGGLFDGPRLVASWRVSSTAEHTADELHVLWDGLFHTHELSMRSVSGACIASVVPSLTPIYTALMRERLRIPAVVVGPDIDLGVGLDVENPQEPGADRLANALAARERYGAPSLVVDFGTATNFDVVNHKGNYAGGAIAPGMDASVEALVSKTARLFRVRLVRPQTAIGRSTAACIQSGAFFGYVGLVEGLIDRIQGELGGHCPVIATGGLASVIAPETEKIEHVEPDLTLEGIRMIWERNAPKKRGAT